ncbi:hypothetical protein DL96DRAFT_1682192 [Flagelloscypha sp. PMI_526]|nr:hypothetical protein DL96DRAFT_1682192 [Flagelloscypha sp. PMI_526]
MAGSKLPPQGTNYISVIHSTLTGVFIAHSFLILLLPLVGALFYFSSRKSRTRPIFFLNLVAIALAFIAGVLLDYRGLRTILSPENPPPVSINLAVGVLGAVQSILVDVILLLRLITVYPRAYIGGERFLALIALPVTLKVGRVINLLIFIVKLAENAHDPVAISRFWIQAPYLKIEWFMQLFDNAYASGFFLWRLVLRTREDRSFSAHSNSSVSFVEKVKTLIWIAATNFVIPCVFSLAQLVIVYEEVNYVIVNDIVLVNTMLAVFGVVFATIWAGTTHKRQEETASAPTDSSDGPNSPRGDVISAMVFNSRGATNSQTQGGDIEAGDSQTDGEEILNEKTANIKDN